MRPIFLAIKVSFRVARKELVKIYDNAFKIY